MSSKKKIAAVVLTTVALSVGSVGVASATKAKPRAVSVRTTVTKSTVNAIGNPMAGQEVELNKILSDLVSKGTINQSQADAITVAIKNARAAHEASRVADRATNDARRAAHEALIASTIGIDAATIKSRLAAGESLGAIAGDKKAALISALVVEATKNIDAEVAAGKMTATQATTLKADLTAHITAEVNAVRGAMGPGMGMGGPGQRGIDGDHRKGPRH